ncbi:hypothetical protein MMC25_001861 [Agyrium rufum]|nr:hypothetical protein [Agyrium rufum]
MLEIEPTANYGDFKTAQGHRLEWIAKTTTQAPASGIRDVSVTTTAQNGKTGVDVLHHPNPASGMAIRTGIGKDIDPLDRMNTAKVEFRRSMSVDVHRSSAALPVAK